MVLKFPAAESVALLAVLTPAELVAAESVAVVALRVEYKMERVAEQVTETRAECRPPA